MQISRARLEEIANRAIHWAIRSQIRDPDEVKRITRLHYGQPFNVYFVDLCQFVMSRPLDLRAARDFDMTLGRDVETLDVIFRDVMPHIINQSGPGALSSEEVRALRIVYATVQWLVSVARKGGPAANDCPRTLRD